MSIKTVLQKPVALAVGCNVLLGVMVINCSACQFLQFAFAIPCARTRLRKTDSLNPKSAGVPFDKTLPTRKRRPLTIIVDWLQLLIMLTLLWYLFTPKHIERTIPMSKSAFIDFCKGVIKGSVPGILLKLELILFVRFNF
jgi:hypothetical protein